jgi:hypothetical protein
VSLWPGDAPHLDPFEDACDIGRPQLAGSTTRERDAGVFHLAGAGTGLRDTRDECHFSWARVGGDFRLTARVEFVEPQHAPLRLAGCLVRTALDDGAPYVCAGLAADDLASLHYRRAPGAMTEHLASSPRRATRLEFERMGHTWMMRTSIDDQPAATSTVTGLDFGPDVYVGLFVCSADPQVLARATFHDVTLER